MEEGSKYTEDELIDAYIRHFKNFDNPEIHEETFWAWEEMNAIEDAVKALELATKAVIKCNDTECIGSIAAGRMEDLFKHAWGDIREAFESLADRHEPLRLVLTSMWIDEKDDCHQDWLRMIEKYGLEGPA